MTQNGKSFGVLRIHGVCLVALLLLVTISVSAQIPTGTILGVVKDATGGTVAGAAITVTNVDTNLTRTGTTSDDGAYRFPGLPVGNYVVRVTKDGFQTAERKGLTLVVDQQAAIDVTLQVGSTGQTVTVTEEAPQVNTTNASTGAVVEEQQVQDLPLNGRNLLDLTIMTPGISQTSITTGPYGENGTMFSSNGSSLRSNMTMLDGAITTTYMGLTFGSVSGTSLGVDGVKEYKVVTSMFGAEYGMVMGSQTAMVSKGGTNAWHGDVFEYLRNSSLDARNYFDTLDSTNHNGFGTDKSLPFPGKRLPPFQRNQFGGSFGGPIQKDKTFFFGVYEGLRQRVAEPIIGENTFQNGCFYGSNVSAAAASSSPTLNASIPLYIDVNSATLPKTDAAGNAVSVCPGAPAAAAGGAASVITVGCPKANVLAAGCSVTPNAAVLQIISQWPQPNVFGLTGTNYTFPFTQPTSENYEQLRMDHNFGAKDSIFARYTADTDGYFDHETYPQWQDHFRTDNLYATGSETHILSPTVLNTARFSFSRTLLIENFDAPALTSLDIIPGEYAASVSPGGGITAGGGGGGDTPGAVFQNLYTISDDIFWTKGKHAFKFGTLINNYTLSYQNKFTTNGTITFSGATPTNLWEGVYSALSVSSIGHQQNSIWKFKTMGWYAQDDFRIFPRLTLNLGFRYEFMTTIDCPPGQCSGIQNLLTYQFGDNTNVHPYLSPAYHNFSPRIGFAWDVFGDGKTSLRGGGGIYYDVVPNPGAQQAANGSGDPTRAKMNTISVPSGSPDPVPFSISPVFPPFNPTAAGICVFPVVQAGSCTPTATNGIFANGTPWVQRVARVLDYHLQQPTSAQWNLTVDRQLPWGMGLSVAYVGSKGWHIMMTTEGNATIPLNFNGPGGTPTYCIPDNSATAKLGACTVASSANFDPRTNTNFGQTQHYTAAAWTFYNGLQVSLTKRITHGLQFGANYTWSHALDDGQKVNSDAGSGAYAGQNTVGYLQLGDKGPAFTDIRHNARFNVTYHAPNVASDRLWAAPLHGWWFGSIMSFQTGYPFNPSEGGRSLENNGNTTDRPNLDPSYNPATVITGDPNNWFNPTMFDLPAAGTLGNAGRDILRGPNLKDVDLSFNKDTRAHWLGEQGNIQFRVEVFNIFNHPNFLAPAGTMWAGAFGTCGAANCTTGTSASGQFCGTLAGQPYFVSGCQVPILNAGGSITAGKITATSTHSRQMQLALKVVF